MAPDRPLIVLSASPHFASPVGIRDTKRLELCKFLFDHGKIFKNAFRFKSTRGLYSWITGGYKNDPFNSNEAKIYSELAKWPITPAAYPGQHGGVVELANEIVAGRCKVVLFFIANADQAGVESPANQALARICNYKNVAIYFNSTSASFWAECLKRGSVSPDDYLATRDPIRIAGDSLADPVPLQINTPLSAETAFERCGLRVPISKRTLALISHDGYKEPMRNFVFLFERTLQKFSRIITTGTTGERILDLVPSLRSKLLRYESGPKGGDIRIAFEILAGTCHDVVFFMDPLHPHPHAADIRVLTLACNQAGANLITNQTAAKDWINMLTLSSRDRGGAA